MNTKHFCLLGLSKQIEEQLKTYIATHAPNHQINWVPANAKQLDGIIVNALFLETPQIKKYLSAVECIKIAAYKNQQEQNTMNAHGLAGFDLNEPLSQNNHQWLGVLLGETEHKAPANSLPQLQAEAAAQKNTALTPMTYLEVIQKIGEHKAAFITGSYQGKTTHLLPAEGYAYIDFPRDEIAGIERWQWQESDDALASEGMRRLNISQWLFEAIWQSKSEDFIVDGNMLYKLIKWPQPFSQSGRTEALRLAAQIKFKPVTIADLADKTNYSQNLVQQFLFATVKAGQVEAISPQSVPRHVQSTPISQKHDPDREVKKSFLGRLRQKLGL